MGGEQVAQASVQEEREARLAAEAQLEQVQEALARFRKAQAESEELAKTHAVGERVAQASADKERDARLAAEVQLQEAQKDTDILRTTQTLKASAEGERPNHLAAEAAEAEANELQEAIGCEDKIAALEQDFQGMKSILSVLVEQQRKVAHHAEAADLECTSALCAEALSQREASTIEFLRSQKDTEAPAAAERSGSWTSQKIGGA